MARWSFTEHPEAVGESYTEHFATASYFGRCMILAGFACLLHGLFPFLFVKTGSKMIAHLHDRMVQNRSRAAAPTGTPEPARN
jgi:hypothetical protein